MVVPVGGGCSHHRWIALGIRLWLLVERWSIHRDPYRIGEQCANSHFTNHRTYSAVMVAPNRVKLVLLK